MLALQDDVSAAIASAVEFKLEKRAPASGLTSGTGNSAAYDAYLEGRYFWNDRSEQGHLKAIKYFERAIAENPRYAQGYSGLADAYALLGSNPGSNVTRQEAMAKARAAALKAHSLDDSLAGAHTSLAFIYWHYDWNWSAAEKEFQRALQLNPSYPTAHHWYAYYLISQGRTEKALEEIHRAQESDPLSLIINTGVAEMLYYARRYDAAILLAKKVFEMDPNFILALNVQAWSQVQEHHYSEAIAEFKSAMLKPGGHSMGGGLAATYALSGDGAEARKLLAHLVDESKTHHIEELWISIASVYGALGDRDDSFAWLEKALNARDGGLTLIRLLPFLDSLHSDPRFADLVHRIGLPQ